MGKGQDKIPAVKSHIKTSDRHLHDDASNRALSTYIFFRSANKKIQKAVSRNLAEYGLSDSKFGVLRSLEDKKSCNMSEIIPWVLVGNSGISGLVSRMKKEGLLDISNGKDDARERHVKLTKKGRETLDKSLTPHREFVADLMRSILTDEEVEQAQKILMKLNQGLDKVVTIGVSSQAEVKEEGVEGNE